MPKTAKDLLLKPELYNPGAINGLALNIGRTISLMKPDDLEKMLQYFQVLQKINTDYNQNDETQLQKDIDELSSFPEFLEKTMPSIAGSAFKDRAIMRDFEYALLKTGESLGIDFDYEKIVGEKMKITIEGKEYTREEFHNKLYENHWVKGEDDQVIDLIFDTCRNSSFIGLNKDIVQAKDETMSNLIQKTLHPHIPLKEKREFIDFFANWNGLANPAEFKKISESMEQAVQLEAREWDHVKNHEADKKKFLDEAALNGWGELPGDREILGELYDARYNSDFTINADIDGYLKKLQGSGSDLKARNSYLNSLERMLKDLTGANSDKERKKEEEAGIEASKWQSKALQTISGELKVLGDVGTAASNQEYVINTNRWYGIHNTDEKGKKLLRDMYLATKLLPENKEYEELVSKISVGYSSIYPEYKLMENQRGVLAAVQTVEEFEKAAGMLQSSDHPFVKTLVGRLENFAKEIKGTEDYKKQLEAKEVLLNWAGVNEQEKSTLNDYANQLENLENNEVAKKLAQNLKLLASYDREISLIHRDLNKDKKGVDQPKDQDIVIQKEKHEEISEAFEYLKAELPKFFHKLNPKDITESSLFSEGKKLSDIRTFKILDQTEYRKIKETVDDALRFSRELETRVKDFDAEVNKLIALKEKFATVSKAYFGHFNGTEYQNMVDKLDTIKDVRTEDDLKHLKDDLGSLAKTYLDHTGLDAASKSHPNAEIRRLCAFDLLSLTDRKTYDQYFVRANKVREGADKLTQEKLDAMHSGELGKNKTSLDDLIREEYKERVKKEKKKPKAKTENKVQTGKEIQNEVQTGNKGKAKGK